MTVMSNSATSQWLFPVSCLEKTPTTLDKPLYDEMYDRARGVEFLFRMGSSIGMHLPGVFTAATWFHRFYMRHSMEDYHRQIVAASCIFLATKTEECGRKLRDIAKVVWAKVNNISTDSVGDVRELDEISRGILLTEEVLLEALCFDFIVDSPHYDLVSLFENYDFPDALHDHALSIANDSYRTPLCILYPPRIIAAASFILAQRLYDGPHSLSLDARISPISPSASLPTPPPHNPSSPDPSREVIEFMNLDANDAQDVIDTLDILLEFYRHTSKQNNTEYSIDMAAIEAPKNPSPRPKLYRNEKYERSHAPPNLSQANAGHATPDSSHGHSTPSQPGAKPHSVHEGDHSSHLDPN